LGLVNTRDINNQYLFAGFQSGAEPFGPAAGGGFNYEGDEGQFFIQIAESLNVAVSDSGKAIFVDVKEPVNFTATANAGNAGTAVIANQAVTNQEDFNAFHPDDAIVTFSVVGGLTSYTVTRASDGGVLSGGVPPEPLLNVPYIEGEAIEFEGIHLNVTGIPANGDVVDVGSDPESRLDMLGVVEKLQLGLETLGNTTEDNLLLAELVADTLLSFENVLANISETQSGIGARLNSIDDVRSSNADRELISRDILSQLEDLDYAEALSNLTQQSFILEASQQSFVRVSGLTLFNFI
jgi:flagellar hook-associated protein 3 FlgL